MVPLVTSLLAGCAGSGDPVGSLMVAPGKYQFYDCAALVRAMQSDVAQAKELEALMAKAQTGPAGQFVSAAAYQPSYLSLRGEMNELRREAGVKHCDLSSATTPPPAKPATPTPKKPTPKKPTPKKKPGAL